VGEADGPFTGSKTKPHGMSVTKVDQQAARGAVEDDCGSPGTRSAGMSRPPAALEQLTEQPGPGHTVMAPRL
jgi:hypothetical protein